MIMKILTIGSAVLIFAAIMVWSFVKAYKKPSCCCNAGDKKKIGCCCCTSRPAHKE